MKTYELVLIGAGAFLLIQSLTKNKLGDYVGESVGTVTGGFITGTTTGILKSVLINPYEWAKNYEGYIPIVDDVAKLFANYKLIGDNDAWLW